MSLLVLVDCYVFFFFKQKTAYEMRISDWSSDVCSSDLIKLFMKLPSKFKIDTPVGPYNPDWAIIKHEDGQDRVYMIRETKSTLEDSKLRPSELAKDRKSVG